MDGCAACFPTRRRGRITCDVGGTPHERVSGAWHHPVHWYACSVCGRGPPFGVRRPCGVGAPRKNLTFRKAGDDGLYVVRLSAVIAMVYVANIWLGLYHNGSEWPWQHMFLILLMGFLALRAAGRSLGLDALLRRDPLGRSLAAGAGVPAGLLSTNARQERARSLGG
jgi:hypothetical protein